MKIKGLRQKISFVLIVPLAIGILLTTLAPFIYLLMYYPNFLNDYTDKMISNQKNTLIQISSLAAKGISYSYVQKIFNFINVGGDLMDQYLFYGLDTSQNINKEKVFYNYKATDVPKNASVWIWRDVIEYDDLSNMTKANLDTAAIFDPIMKAITQVGITSYSKSSDPQGLTANKDETFRQNYIAFSNDGLFYMNPLSNASTSDTCFDSTIKPNCSSCVENHNISYYDPRCRIFYNATLHDDTFEAILIDPYSYAGGNTGQSVCRGQWNFTSSDLVLVFCADFGTGDIYEKNLVDLLNKGPTYSYVLNVHGELMAYKSLDLSGNKKKIEQLEFNGDSSESESFRKKMLPLFENQVSEFKYYTKDGNKMMAAVSPIMMQSSSKGNIDHIASIAIVMKKSHLESKFNDLKSTCTRIMYIQIIIQLILLIPILVFCVILTDNITKSIICPIDRLAQILKKMKEGDLAIDIIASYVASPSEISILYEVFDKLRVVLRFNAISPDNMTEAFFVYSQALNLFIHFGNERGMEVCNREIGYICFKQKQWETSAYYLNSSLELAKKLNLYPDEEIARRKTETAKAFIKTGNNHTYAMNLFAEALDTFSKINDSTRIVLCLIEISETLVEANELTSPLLDFIERNLEYCENYERSVINQRFLLIKSSYLKNNKKYKQACVLISNILEMHADFIPDIWISAVNLLIEICRDNGVDWSYIAPLRSVGRFIRKDIVLIMSDSLAKGPISWILPRFLKSILEENDRLSMLQFGSSYKVKFNLTRFPMKIFTLEEQGLITNEKRLMYDCIQEGFRQLRVNSLFKKKDSSCKEYVIIVTDCVDLGSESKFVDFIAQIERTDVEVVVVNCFLEERIFDALKLVSEKCLIFHIKFQEQARIVFKEIEAYLCPYKEVYLVDI